MFYKIEEKNLKTLTDAFNLLNDLEVKGLKNNQTIVTIAGLLQTFQNSLQKIEEPASIVNPKKEDK